MTLPLAVAALLVAADPGPRRLDLWRADAGGYALYRIPGLVRTPAGILLAVCEARRSARGDWGPIDLQLRRSADGGTTWADPVTVSTPPADHRKNPAALAQKLADPAAVTFNNPVLIPGAAAGVVHLVYCLEYMRCFHAVSTDDGRTFGPPAEITAAFEAFRPTYPWKVLATGPGHGIRLRTGRLLVPVWLSTGTGGHAHRPSVVSTLVSDDAGRSWKLGEVVANETDPLVNPNETTAAELADGRVMLNIRSESKANRRAVSVSPDGTTAWSRPRFDDALPEPVCMGSLCRLTTGPDRTRLLFCNPANLDRAAGPAKPGQGRDRKTLTVRLSYDEGATWAVSKVLEPGPGGYSDLAVGADGTIHCLYESRGGAGPSAGALTLASFTLDWLTDGKDRLPAR
jgi:sialidase-1